MTDGPLPYRLHIKINEADLATISALKKDTGIESGAALIRFALRELARARGVEIPVPAAPRAGGG